MVVKKVLLVLIFAVSVISRFSKSAPIDSKLVGLYGPDDNVTILTGLNFNETVFNSPFVWMVEFYASWCGHCQEFAPTFKAFAKDVAEWEQVYRLAVINCPDDINHPICVGMDVRAYPDMRIFPPFSDEDLTGMKISEHTVANLRNLSVYYIDQYLDEIEWNLPGVLRPTFHFITYEEILNFWMYPEMPFYLTLVIEMPSSDMGKQIILDISSCKNITTRRFNSASPEIKKLVEYTGINFQEIPTVVVMEKGGKAYEIDVKIRRRSFYTYKIRELPGVGDPKPLPKQVLNPGSSSLESYIDWTKIDRSKVYLADIESGLRYALTVEVASTKVLEGRSLDALQKFVGTLALLSGHLPASEPTQNFIARLIGWMAGQSSIGYKTWEERMKIVEPESYLPKVDQRWVGCAPSKPGLRGYPCSLWTLFHSLTVAAYNKNEQDVLAVPQAMEAYITNFFSCMECRRNFIREIMDTPYDDIKSTKEAILWLWELHNKVNKRLHGALSEDPNIPKVQFPPEELCRVCRNENGSWNRGNVLKFLINRYSSDNVSKNYFGRSALKDPVVRRKSNFEVIHGRDIPREILDRDFGMDVGVQAVLEDNDFDTGEKEYDSPKDSVGRNRHPHLINELHRDRKKGESLHVIKHVADKELRRRIEKMERELSNPIAEPRLTTFDTSVCVVLWGTSLAVVVFLYLYLRRRSTLKKCRV